MCGGTRPELVEGTDREGLSPRVRGNPPAQCYPVKLDRSIPACAGEPPFGIHGGIARPVYPRVCGGTQCDRIGQTWGSGLSPRVRGNLETTGVVLPLDGSIPACAGEPTFREIADVIERVYPRVCGGTPLG